MSLKGPIHTIPDNLKAGIVMLGKIDGNSLIGSLQSNPPKPPTKTEDVAHKVLISDGTSNYWLTTGNIKRAGWTFLAAASASPLIFHVFSVTIGVATTTLLPISFLLTVGCLWSAYKTADYDNTAEVATYREECKHLSLEEAFKKYGKWISERKLLTQEQVTVKYKDLEKKITHIPDILGYHQKTRDLIKKGFFTLPSPKESNQERFQKSCSTLSLDEAIDLYTLEYIFTWQLFTPSELNEKYIEKENSLKGLPALWKFYQEMENHRKQFDTENIYSIPDHAMLKKKIQEDCSDMSLKEIERLHTLEFLFSWNLLTPEQFTKKYEEEAETLFSTEGIRSVIAYYKKMQKIRNTASARGLSYPIPTPEGFSPRWLNKNYSLEEVLFQHNLKELIEYKIIKDPFLIDSLHSLESQFLKSETNYKQFKENIEKEETLSSIASPVKTGNQPPSLLEKKQKETRLDESKTEFLRKKIHLEQEYALIKSKLKN